MRFLPPAVEPYVVAAERGETGGGRRPAARAVVAEYTSAPRILTGVGLWLGVVAALVLAVVGAVAVLDAVVGTGSVGAAAAGVVSPLAAVAGAAEPLAEVDVLGEEHLGDDLVAVELDALDLADPHAGDPHLVAGLQPAALGELGVVGVAAADQRQAVGAEGGQQQRRDDGDADRADDDGVAVAERDAHRSHLPPTA